MALIDDVVDIASMPIKTTTATSAHKAGAYASIVEPRDKTPHETITPAALREAIVLSMYMG